MSKWLREVTLPFIVSVLLLTLIYQRIKILYSKGQILFIKYIVATLINRFINFQLPLKEMKNGRMQKKDKCFRPKKYIQEAV